MLDRKEVKQIAQFVLKEFHKSTYAYATDAKFDYRKQGQGKLKGGTIRPIGVEFQHYSSDIAWTSTGEDTITWTSGNVALADGRTQSIVSGGKTLVGTSPNYFWMEMSNTVVQDSTTYYDGVGDDKALLAFATKAPANDQIALVYPFFGTEPTFNSDVMSANMIIAAHIKAGVITASKLSFSAFDKDIDDLDDVDDGTTYSRLYDSQLDAHYIKLTAASVKSSDWYDETGVIIHADSGISLYGGLSGGKLAFRTYPTKADYTAGTNLQCSVDTNGKISAGGGNVTLDSAGLTIDGTYGYFKILNTNSSYIYMPGILELRLIAPVGGTVTIGTTKFEPVTADIQYIGASGNRFGYAYIKYGHINYVYTDTRLRIPVGTNMYG